MATIFYAWQSDAPNNVNRGFIRKALDQAIAALNDELDVDESLDVDQDTQGVPGSPPIAETILRKIDECELFLADVTFVGQTRANDILAEAAKSRKLLPNANVLIELGYCLGKRGPTRLIMVMNSHYGPPSGLPFDLAHRRHPIQFSLAPDATEPTRLEQRQLLVSQLKDAIRTGRLALREAVGTGPNNGATKRVVQSGSFMPNGRLMEFDQEGVKTEVMWRNQPQVYLRVIPSGVRGIGTSVKLQELARDSSCPLQPFGPKGQAVQSTVRSARQKDGYVTAVVAPNNGRFMAVAVTKLFGTGELWGIDQHLLRANENLGGRRVIPSGALRRAFENGLDHYLGFCRSVLQVTGPVRMIAGLEFVDGLPLVLQGDRFSEPSVQHEVHVDAVVSNLATNAASVLAPLYKQLWDACGEQFEL